MPGGGTNARAELRRGLGAAKPPEKITQASFDGDGRELKRLVQLADGERADGSDLLEYVHILCYVKEIQTDLFAYLLPVCLEEWARDLHSAPDAYSGVIEYLPPAFANPNVTERHLTHEQAAVASAFVREEIVKEMDEQRGLSYGGARARPYRWVRATTTYGVFRPDIELLWKPWWAAETVGRAVAVVQYASCLMYENDENPVFAPWTPKEGGGPPILWEFDGHLYDHCWLEPNVAFLRGALTLDAVEAGLGRAVARLAGEPEHGIAVRVRDDVPMCSDMIEARCAELVGILASKDRPGAPRAWSI
jgi:hypothetical protein